MQFVIRDVVGFELTEEVLENLQLTEGFNKWKKDYSTSDIGIAMEENFGIPAYVEPMIRTFEYERGGEIQGLEGFEWGKTYCWFFLSDTKAKGWKKFENRLKKKGVALHSARWSELS